MPVTYAAFYPAGSIFPRLLLLKLTLLWAVSCGGEWALGVQPPDSPGGEAELQAESPAPAVDGWAAELAAGVTIHRDAFGVPHIFAQTDESAVFGFAYAQAEDYFWQIEDTYVLALGRYAQLHGWSGLNSDLLNRGFEIVPSSRRDFPKLDPQSRRMCEAFVAGLNFFLAKNPHVRTRIIKEFQPWHVLAYHRHLTLELCFRYTRLAKNHLPRQNPRIWAATGSNAWAIGPARTATGSTMLMVNPHLPWYGLAQLYEAHLCSEASGRSWNFTGATFLGNPLLTIGHNEHLGWTMTTNEPDIADLWRVRFPNPDKPLEYPYGEEIRKATQWEETITIKSGDQVETRSYTFRKTHHGPLVAREDATTWLAARIAGLYDVAPTRQALRMMQASNLEEFRSAIALLQIPFMNILYADRQGNIFYLYGASCPQRDPQFDWTKPVDGNDQQTSWRGVHGIDELPQVLNPPSGFLQNCNSSPLITSDGSNPKAENFPPYLMEDGHIENRRALRSLEILRTMKEIQLDDLERLAFDTTVHWAKHELPKFAARVEEIRDSQPELAASVEPLLRHLLEWDRRITLDSTAATLCEAWFEELYGYGYPGEKLKSRYRDNPRAQLAALARAATTLARLHGDWKVPYGRIHRIQRRAYTAEIAPRFNDRAASLPCLGGHGPMGVIFTQYYTPSIHIPLIMSQKKRYGVVGPVYLGIYEFTADGVRSKSVVPYGASGIADSPHFFDQAELLSATRMKAVPFHKQDVLAAAVRSYHPGDQRDP